MVETIIEKMLTSVKELEACILEDIEDIKAAKHENLLDRNDTKNNLITDISDFKEELNIHLVQAMKDGIDVNMYKEKVDNLEEELRQLYALNSKLASIVEPVQKMYKDIVDDIAKQNGGNLFDVKA